MLGFKDKLNIIFLNLVTSYFIKKFRIIIDLINSRPLFQASLKGHKLLVKHKRLTQSLSDFLYY